MMKKKNLYVLMAAAFVLASCAKSEDPASVNNDEVEFSVKSSVIGVNVTRAAYEGTTPTTTAPLTARVLTSATPLNYNTLHCDGTMTFTSNTNVSYNKPVPTGSTYTFSGGTNYYLSALYPDAGWTITSGKASRTLTGKEDVMFAPQDITNKTAVTGGTYPTMAFAHKLTYLRLLFSGDSDATTAVTKVTNIQLAQVNGTDIPTTVVVDLSTTGQPVTFTGTATSLFCYDGTTDATFAVENASGYTVPLTTPVEKAYILAPPAKVSAAASYEYTFKIDYTVGTSPVVNKSLSVNVDLTKALGGTTSLPAEGVSVEGYAFDININFLGGQIVAIATIADWKDGGGLTVDL